MNASRPLRRLAIAFAPWAFPVAVLIVWEAAARSGLIPPRLLPAPSAVAIAFWENARSGVLFHHMAISAGRALQGILIGGGIGFVLGVLNGVSKRAETLLDSTLQMLRNVPHLAIIPLVRFPRRRPAPSPLRRAPGRRRPKDWG